jgi:sialate O-acetylesterase
MQMGVAAALNGTEEIAAAAAFPNIRLFTVGQLYASSTPLDVFEQVAQPWSVASPQALGNGEWTYFSAVCWYFARQLQETLHVPIGLVSSNWGGTNIKVWSSPDALSSCRQPDHDPVVPSPPNFPIPTNSSCLWNSMIVPLLPMRLSGMLWYQG